MAAGPTRRLTRPAGIVGVFAAALVVAALTAPIATAALLVTANDDGPYAAVHDRALTVSAANGVLANDSGVGSHRGTPDESRRTGP